MNVINGITSFEKHEVQRRAEQYDELQDVYQSHANLAEDIFSAFYRASPRVADDDSIGKEGSIEDRIRASAIRNGLATKEWRSLKTYTVRDAEVSALCIKRIGDSIISDLENNQDYRDHLKSQDEYNALMQDMDSGECGEFEIPESWKRYADSVQSAARQAERRSMRASATALEVEIEQAADIKASFGITSGDNHGMNPKQAAQLVSTVLSSHKLQEIARLAGRMERVAMAAHETRCTHRHETIIDVHTGDDIGHVLPSELVSLAHPSLRPAFIDKWQKKSLLCYDLEGKEPFERGPIIIVYDESGSMEGVKEIWAKALVFGFLRIAEVDNRDVLAVAFSSKGEIEEFEFESGVKDPQKLLDLAVHFFNGGTDPEGALLKVHEKFYEGELGTNNRNRWDKADMIFITDDEFSLGEKCRECVKKMVDEGGMRIITIGVGCGRVKQLSDFASEELTISRPSVDRTDEEARLTDIIYAV